MSSILLVEDDFTLIFGIEFTLKSEGFDVMSAGSIRAARESYGKDKFDLILLDLKLPDGSGYDFCREIREVSDIPIIFLTASDEEVNIVSGLDMGADDYITKPFRIRELISRIKAVLRRGKKVESDVLVSGDIEIYTSQGRVKKKSEDVILTALEYRLLLTFMKNPGKVMSRTSILEGLWDIDGEFVDDNTLSVYIRRLREKIEDDPGDPKYILTYRGMGYRWDIDVKGGV